MLHSALHNDFDWERIKLEEPIDLVAFFFSFTWQYYFLHPENNAVTTLSI